MSCKPDNYLLEELIESLSSINDPRDSRTLHPLMDILVISVLAVMSGAETMADIETFAIEREKWLRKFIELPVGLPSYDTYSRVLSILDPKELDEAFTQWVRDSVLGGVIPETISIDGKSIKGTERRFKTVTNGRPLHVVSAYSHRYGLTLTGESTSTSGSESISAIECLKRLDIKGSMILADAAFSTNRLAEQIKGQKGDYIFPIKRNQRHSLKEIEDLFAKNSGESANKINDGHGRQEVRTIRVISTDSLSDNFKSQWPGCKLVFELTRTRVAPDRRANIQVTGPDGGKLYRRNTATTKKSQTITHFVCSRVIDASTALSLVREHWGIENGLHWMLDVAFREDNCLVRAKHLAFTLHVLRKIALNMIRSSKTTGSIRTRMKRAALNEKFHEQLLQPKVMHP
ncbi:MAG: ISAs1 family transposase [Proteobacteria bacterium]|nr:ISAs1 family transposase [Pseudomonadota bacterium]